MNWRNIILLGLIGTTLSAIACAIYARIYTQAFYVDFSKVIALPNMIAACAIGCFLMATGYALAIKWKGEKTVGWLNVAYSVLSFASIVGVLGFNLPLDIESPEMFPGMVIPMHFFPALSVLSVYPLLKSK
ncbi:MAG: hypothetical protein IT236_06160 [Bacteroidia bacterium]|nr:hypothetical protein [Bacteroidia bacterium]